MIQTLALSNRNLVSPSESVRGIATILMLGATIWLCPPRWNRLDGKGRIIAVSLVLYGVFACVSALWSPDGMRTLVQGMFALVTVLIPVIAMAGRWTEAEVLRMDLTAVYVALVGLNFVGVLVAPESTAARSGGAFHNPNAAGVIAAMVICLGFGLMFAANRKFRWMYIFPCQLLLLWVLLQSQSRTSIAAIGGTLLYLGLRRASKRLRRVLVRLAVVLVAALSLAGLLGFTIGGTFRSVYDRFEGTGDGSYLSGREFAWDFAVDEWRHSPVIGNGFRSAGALFKSRGGFATQSTIANVDSVHNGYLQVLLELGIIGLGLLAVSATAALLRRSPVSSRSRLAIWIAASAMLVCGLFNQFGESTIIGSIAGFPLLYFSSVCALGALRDDSEQHGQSGSTEPQVAADGV
jgi:O-antigen ligase